jgi:hypothetical protein
MQQVGGSVGTALLSSIAGTAAAGFVGPPLAAALYGYTTAFTVASGIFVVGTSSRRTRSGWCLAPAARW